MADGLQVHRAGAETVPEVFRSEGVAGRFVSATPAATATFAHAMSRQLPEGLLRKVPETAPVREIGGPAKMLNDLSNYLSGRQQMVVRMMDVAVRTGSPEQMLKVNAAMIDNGVETDLLAKTIGKTVSAVDQLTKLN
jgi:hypothetical protein